MVAEKLCYAVSRDSIWSCTQLMWMVSFREFPVYALVEAFG